MGDVDRYYKILELEPGALPEQVKQAYRDLVNVWHPDRFAHDSRLQQKAEEKLKEINEAYERLRAIGPASSVRNSQSGPCSQQQRAYQKQSDGGAWQSQAPPNPSPTYETSRESRKPKPVRAWLIWLLAFLLLQLVIQLSRPPNSNTPTLSEAPLAPLISKPSAEDVSSVASQSEERKLQSPRAESSETPITRTSVPEGFFAIDSTKDEVLSVQGTPDRFTDNSFHYGASDVYFREGRVAYWNNGYPKLKVMMLPSTATTIKSYFTIGSTKDDVLAIQGTPDRFTDESFRYGASHVYFKNGRVSSWDSNYPKLKVRMESQGQ